MHINTNLNMDAKAIEWHQRNKMLKNANIDQRIDWHIRHQKNCSCIPIPDKVKDEMKKRGMD